MSIDREKVKEVIAFAENDYDSYKILTTTYFDNLKRKRLNGTYDKAKSGKLLEYYYSNYVRKEMIKPRKYGFDSKLNPQERKMFGTYFANVLWSDYIKNIKPKPKKK